MKWWQPVWFRMMQATLVLSTAVVAGHVDLRGLSSVEAACVASALGVATGLGPYLILWLVGAILEGSKHE